MKNTVCQITNCNKPMVAKGYCHMHYRRNKLYGDPNKLLTEQHFHGMSNSPEYRIWTHMLGRCNNPNDSRYEDYGGRGIKVEFETFADFLEEVGERPNPKLTIDRINNNGNYAKGNLRWTTYKQQNLNKRTYKSNLLGYRNIRLLHSGRYSVRKSIGNGKQMAVGTFNTLEDALENQRV